MDSKPLSLATASILGQPPRRDKKQIIIPDVVNLIEALALIYLQNMGVFYSFRFILLGMPRSNQWLFSAGSVWFALSLHLV